MILPTELAGGAPLFHPGLILITPAARQHLTRDDMETALTRHLHGDWSGMDAEGRAANGHAVRDGLRVFSLYLSAANRRFYIVTEADRSVTTIMMPFDYCGRFGVPRSVESSTPPSPPGKSRRHSPKPHPRDGVFSLPHQYRQELNPLQ
jgi:hypothetical protein